MRIPEIRKMIKKALDDEKRTGRLANTVRSVARRNGNRPNEEQIAGVVTFVTEYVQQVPYYLEQSIAKARQVGMVREMTQMMSELEVYWFEGGDFIPDNLGLLGIMDDAYASLSLLQAVSDFCTNTMGRPLLAENITPANQAIRQLIGEPTASQIDQHVALKLPQTLLQQLVGQIAAGNLAFGSLPPFWGQQAVDNYELERYVDIQLGAMGVV